MMAAISWGIEMAAIKPRAIKFVIGPNTRDRRDVIARYTHSYAAFSTHEHKQE
jgi:hypothetical protein